MKKKLLFIGSLPPPYHGVNIQNGILLSSDLSREFDILHLDTSDHRDLNNLGQFDLNNIFLGFKHLIGLIRHLVINRPDIMYMTVAQNTIAFFRDGLFILLGKMLSNVKIVVHFRGSGYLDFYEKSNIIFKKFMNYTFYKCDGGIVLGKNLKAMVYPWFNENSIFVVPNGSNFSPDLSKKQQAGKDEVHLSYIGFLGVQKGIGEFLTAIHRLNEHIPDQKIVVNLAGDFAYGDEDFRTTFYEFLKENSLQDMVKLWGTVSGNQKESFFLNTDIFVFPSWIEGHPNAILEAMSSSCPIVATNVGAIPESVIDGYNGLLIEPKSSSELTDKLLYLINNPDLRIEMGLNSKKLFDQKFNVNKYVQNMIDVFKSVAKVS